MVAAVEEVGVREDAGAMVRDESGSVTNKSDAGVGFEGRVCWMGVSFGDRELGGGLLGVTL